MANPVYTRKFISEQIAAGGSASVTCGPNNVVVIKNLLAQCLSAPAAGTGFLDIFVGGELMQGFYAPAGGGYPNVNVPLRVVLEPGDTLELLTGAYVVNAHLSGYLFNT